MASQVIQGLSASRVRPDGSLENEAPGAFVIMIGYLTPVYLDVETAGGDFVTLVNPNANATIPILVSRIISGDITLGNIIALW